MLKNMQLFVLTVLISIVNITIEDSVTDLNLINCRKRLRMIIGPCKECDRQGCGRYHEICPEYKKYKAEIETERSNRIKEYKKETHYKYGQFKNHKNKFIKCHKK